MILEYICYVNYLTDYIYNVQIIIKNVNIHANSQTDVYLLFIMLIAHCIYNVQIII